MQDDRDIPIDQVDESSDENILDPEQANNLNGSIHSGGDPDSDELTEDFEDENRQPGISPDNQ